MVPRSEYQDKERDSKRAVFSEEQRKDLEKTFHKQKYISKTDRNKLAEHLGLKESQVKIWFQNRRMKWRNSKEKETFCHKSCEEKKKKIICWRVNYSMNTPFVQQQLRKLKTHKSQSIAPKGTRLHSSKNSSKDAALKAEPSKKEFCLSLLNTRT